MSKTRIRVQAQSVRMGEVVPLDCVTKLDLNPDTVIAAALRAGLTDVVIVGYDADGDEYFASSMADGGAALWLLERCKKALLDIGPSDVPPAADNPEGAVLQFKRAPK